MKSTSGSTTCADSRESENLADWRSESLWNLFQFRSRVGREAKSISFIIAHAHVFAKSGRTGVERSFWASRDEEKLNAKLMISLDSYTRVSGLDDVKSDRIAPSAMDGCR